MRLVGLAYVGVVVAVFAAFRVQARTEAPPVAAPPLPPAPTLVAEPLSTTALVPVPEEPAEAVLSEVTQSESPTRNAVAPPAPRRRSYRRRRPRRYPDPPTPADWAPPEGPVRIALQAGHWRADEAPRELSGLKRNGTRWK